MAWMKQKPEIKSFRPVGTPSASPEESSTHTFPRAARGATLVNIGKSITIKGEVTGSEDLTIEGRIEGTVSLQGHAVSIGENGQIHGNIRAQSVTVNGKVLGNVTAGGKVEIGATGSMEGDIRAARIALVDGARFKGGVDVEEKPAARATPPTRSQSASEPAGHTGPPSAAKR